jgi:hypothetical protein
MLILSYASKIIFLSYPPDPGIDGRIILKWIFERLNGGAWTE